VFEGVVYHCYAIDADNPCRPVLEVDAITRPGDLDVGPLLVTVADYMRMAGEAASDCLPHLRRRRRVVEWQVVPHLSFPTWTVVAASEER
jgi:hypothetical protein